VQLVVVDGFLADQDRVGLPGQDLHQARCCASGEPAVLKLSLVGDGLRPDAVEVLEIGTDIGEPMLQGLD
jgi:hypothetical protein